MAQAEQQVLEQTPIEIREPELGDLIHRITDDLKVIAQDEIALARLELSEGLKAPAMDAAAIVVGGVFGLIAFGLLCVTVVVAIEPIIPHLWLRMLIMSGVYFVIGGIIAGYFIQRLRSDAPPQLSRTVHEARRTAETLKKEAQHG